MRRDVRGTSREHDYARKAAPLASKRLARVPVIQKKTHMLAWPLLTNAVFNNKTDRSNTYIHIYIYIYICSHMFVSHSQMNYDCNQSCHVTFKYFENRQLAVR